MAGLRELKKERTRAAIAASAARLFARNGFRAVTMVEVAEAAEVSEQTVYNHFPTKESLVFDRAGELGPALIEAFRRGTDPVDAYADWLSAGVLGESARRAVRNPGGMPRLVASDSGLRRHLLGLAGDWATTLADQLVSDRVGPVAARTLADALLQVFVRTVDRLGVIETQAEIDTLETEARQAVEVLRPAFAAVAHPS